MQKWGAGILLTLLVGPAVMADEYWNNQFTGGVMRFQGELLAETCSVETKDRHLIVTMGQIRTDRFRLAGDEADSVPFDLHLENCNANVSRNVGVVFHGIADEKNPEMLSVGNGPGVARGVAVALFDGNGRFIPLNSAPQYWAAVKEETLTLHFIAKYRATEPSVTYGQANAQAWFALTYQ